MRGVGDRIDGRVGLCAHLRMAEGGMEGKAA